MLPFGDSELIYYEPVVVVRLVEIEYARLRACNRAILAAILDGHTIDKHSMQGAVPFHAGGCICTCEFPVGIFQSFCRKFRIEADERLAKPSLQHHVTVVR